MKCKFCAGSGKDYWCLNGEPYPCPVYNGTGRHEPFDADIELDKLYLPEQTNEEYINTHTGNELRDFLWKEIVLADWCWNETGFKGFTEWLKEIYKK